MLGGKLTSLKESANKEFVEFYDSNLDFQKLWSKIKDEVVSAARKGNDSVEIIIDDTEQIFVSGLISKLHKESLHYRNYNNCIKIYGWE